MSDKGLLNLTEEQASALIEHDPEIAVWAMLQLAAMAKRNTLSAPTLSTRLKGYDKSIDSVRTVHLFSFGCPRQQLGAENGETRREESEEI